MKKVFLFPIMFLLCVLAACSNDDNNDSDKQLTDKEYIINGHKFVDLGLSSGLLWADRNLGAYSTIASGNYYSWGEVSPKGEFTFENYKFYDSTNPLYYTKYNTKDGLNTLLPQDDAATMEWGVKCRIPTKEEVYELMTECKWIGKSDGSGFTVKGPNGNSIFLPMTGMFDGGTHFNMQEYGYYRTSSLSIYGPVNATAYCMWLLPQDVNMPDGYLRVFGMCIRPVATK